MRIDESEGRILARCLAEAIKAEVVLGTYSEWRALNDEAVLSLADFEEIRRHSSKKTIAIIENTIRSFKKQLNKPVQNDAILQGLIHFMLIEAINNADLRREWQHKNKCVQFNYSRRFLVARIQGLQLAVKENPTFENCRVILSHIAKYVRSYSPSIETLEASEAAYKKMELCIEKTQLIGQAINEKKPLTFIQQQLIFLKDMFDFYLSKVINAIDDYRAEVSAASCFCGFFSCEDSKDKACIRAMADQLQRDVHENIERDLKAIILNFSRVQDNESSRLLVIFQASGLVAAQRPTFAKHSNVPDTREPLKTSSKAAEVDGVSSPMRELRERFL